MLNLYTNEDRISEKKILRKMTENLNEINFDHFAYDYFKRNDNEKRIEISKSNQIVPVRQFLLYIDHTDCSENCFVVGFSLT